ncbi:MAG: peptidylprolyl isomerase [Ignavibacteriales bacterium]|nr:MAG: peptidylprolyl isomerase [Ignavibacteriales bacterium]
MKEFEDVYASNVGGVEIAKQDSLSKLKNFLDLYVNFKMKLRDAEIRNYADDPTINAELLDYKKKVGVTFLLEKEIVEPGVADLYEKRKWEWRVSHIMFRPDSAGEGAAKYEALSVLDSIKKGASFESMVKYSDDHFSTANQGDIFYVTAGQLPVEFEDAFVNTEVNQVYPDVVKTRFGYHIVKVTDKQERVPQLRASHILVSLSNQEGPVDSIAAKSRIDSVMMRIKSGEDFGELAKEYSDDTGSKPNGGDLGFFERRQMVKEFDEAAFKMKVGDVSDVIRTAYGYHIIKLTEKKAYPSFDEEKENLKKIYKQTRYQSELDKLMTSLKGKFRYNLNEDNLNTIVAKSDSVKFSTMHPKMEELKDLTVFTYSGKTYPASKLFEIQGSMNDFSNRFINITLLHDAVKKATEDVLLEEEALTLEKTRPDFAALMDNYRNGTYIFKIQDDEVWKKIEIDSVKLYNHYQQTKEKYVWPDRVRYKEIFARKDSVINHYYDLLVAGEEFDSLAFKYTERPGFKEKHGDWGMVDVNSSENAKLASTLEKPGQYTKPVQSPNGYSIIMLVEKDPSRIKTFEEAKAEVSGSFQELESKRLEQEYIESLKMRYKPVINYDKLEKAFKQN